MIKQYLIQAWRLLKENPLLSSISIIGTALAICMIMVMVMSHEVKNASFPPEVNRDRTLYVKYASAEMKDGGSSNGAMGYALAKAGFKELTTPEAVTIVSPYEPKALASIPAEKTARSYDKMLTDEAFWQVFDFSFVAGKPYTKADVDAGLKVAVITEKMAKQLFQITDVVGKTLLLNYTDYTVCGVVKDVSTLATAAYSQVWMPITSQGLYTDEPNQISGRYSVYILAEDKSDFPIIREEAEKLRKKYNESLTDYKAIYRNQPDTHFVYINRKYSNSQPEINKIVIQFIIVLALMLIVPAINLSSMTGSRMRKRMSELGVRRAFGATKSNLMLQILWESLLQTLLGGVLGLILSYVAAYAFKGVIYSNSAMASQLGDATIDFGALLNPIIFVYAFFFCILLNLLSAIIPAWRTSRKPIVDSILSK
ncbi:MAG TPA: ABC transporter permease [Dysgonamonadaceae bacterium]|nr:ABC transporter permease [Dysgonamonadaceae bacterium]